MCSLDHYQIRNTEDEDDDDCDDDQLEEIAPEDRLLNVPFSLESANINNVTLDVNCWHHLRNVWINALSKQIGAHMSKDLREE